MTTNPSVPKPPNPLTDAFKRPLMLGDIVMIAFTRPLRKLLYTANASGNMLPVEVTGFTPKNIQVRLIKDSFVPYHNSASHHSNPASVPTITSPLTGFELYDHVLFKESRKVFLVKSIDGRSVELSDSDILQ